MKIITTLWQCSICGAIHGIETKVKFRKDIIIKKPKCICGKDYIEIMELVSLIDQE